MGENRNQFQLFPAAILYTLNAIVAAAVAYGLPLTDTQTGAITTAATAVLTIITAFAVRPVIIPTITAAAATAISAMAAFGLHVSADMLGATMTLVSVVLALLLHQNVIPTSGRVGATD